MPVSRKPKENRIKNKNAPLLSPRRYGEALRGLLTKKEYSLFSKLDTAGKVQDFLDTLPINFGDTHRSPRFALEAGEAQCIEGALIAAAILAFHGRTPLLMDFQTIPEDEDHVIALFRENGHWGAISKTNHAILSWRDPIYKTPRELAMSFFHEYFMHDGRKSMQAYSEPFDLRIYPPAQWMTPRRELWWIDKDIDAHPHHSPLPPDLVSQRLRNVSRLTVRGLKLVEWKKPPHAKARAKRVG